MKNFIRRLIDRLRTRRTGLDDKETVNANSIPREIARGSNLRVFLWTPDEAEAAWNAGRTKYNLGETFRLFAESLEWMAGKVLVDGELARVVICISETVKARAPVTPLDKKSTFAAREEERWRERLEQAKIMPRPEPIAESNFSTYASKPKHLPQDNRSRGAGEGPVRSSVDTGIHCTNCYATRALSAQNPLGPCCTDFFYTVPYELIWRSLPGGEDR